MKKFIVTFQIHSTYSNTNFDLTDLVEEEYESDNIEDLIEANQTEYYGFEPNKEEFEKLVNSNNKKYFNTAIADGSKKILRKYLI